MSNGRVWVVCLHVLGAAAFLAGAANAAVPAPSVIGGAPIEMTPPALPPVDPPVTGQAGVLGALPHSAGALVSSLADHVASAGSPAAPIAAGPPAAEDPSDSAPSTPPTAPGDFVDSGTAREPHGSPGSGTHRSVAGSGVRQSGGPAQEAARSAPTQTGPAAPRPAARAQAEQRRERSEPQVTVVERIVAVVPLPLKIALATLLALSIAALGGAWHTRRRLAYAERRAATDALTGLPNRRQSDETMECLLAAARRHDRPLSVVLFDLDRFKAINDRFGHGIGDEALRAAAATTREMLRGTDHVARLGGEEFVMLLPDTAGADALTVAEKVRSRIAALDVAGLDGRMTASFGVASFPEHGAGRAELMEAADGALYRAKEAGRNRVMTKGRARLTKAA